MSSPLKDAAAIFTTQIRQRDVTRDDLAKIFGVSDKTIKRHLPKLEMSGEVRFLEEGSGTKPSVYDVANAVPALAESLQKLPVNSVWIRSHHASKRRKWTPPENR